MYEGRGGLCSVRLSLPLLKLRPRRDLVQTLLVSDFTFTGYHFEIYHSNWRLNETPVLSCLFVEKRNYYVSTVFCYHILQSVLNIKCK